jgi:outer membrane protein TolC
VAAAAWARRAQAEDATHVAEAGAADVRRQVAMAAADAYLSVIAQRRTLENETRARDAAQAHADLAGQLERAGSGSRLTSLRAEQQVSQADVRLEAARLLLYRAQEALGVLLVADGPVDARDEPAFQTPPEGAATPTSLLQFRTDLRYFSAQQDLAARAVTDTRRENWPTLDAVLQPQTIYPTPFFTTANSWRFLLQSSIPIYTGGVVGGRRTERQAALDQARAQLALGVAQAGADVRVAREAIASFERSLASARSSADQASQVVNIENISFRAGGATSIEVIDAERTARDADAAVAAAEDALRRARLDLLIALGRFP